MDDYTKGAAIQEVDPKEVVRFVQKLGKDERETKAIVEEIVDEAPEEIQSWRAELYSILTTTDRFG